MKRSPDLRIVPFCDIAKARGQLLLRAGQHSVDQPLSPWFLHRAKKKGSVGRSLLRRKRDDANQRNQQLLGRLLGLHGLFFSLPTMQSASRWERIFNKRKLTRKGKTVEQKEVERWRRRAKATFLGFLVAEDEIQGD